MAQVSGVALAALAAGGLFVFSGIKGKSVTQALQYVIQGKNPGTAPQANPIASSDGGSEDAGPVTAQGGNPDGTSEKTNQATGKLMAAAYGWATGAEWTALNNIVMAESGWSDTVVNSSSGAAGIAQKISGWSSDYQEGNAMQQIAWMLSYIKGRYGDPVKAWQFHLANGYY